jgi:hypothetical protein
MTRTTIKRIHVNRHVIKSNTKHDESNSVFTVKNRGRTIIADSVEILGPCKLVYAPEDPLSCGAKVWIETHALVKATLATNEIRDLV